MRETGKFQDGSSGGADVTDPCASADRSSTGALTPLTMKKEYGFKYGRRGAVLRGPSAKTRITIRIDDDILEWFRKQVHKAGGGRYQTLINEALRTHAEATEQNLEDTLRRVLREELPRYAARPEPRPARR